jgi:hypothetical protein
MRILGMANGMIATHAGLHSGPKSEADFALPQLFPPCTDWGGR